MSASSEESRPGPYNGEIDATHGARSLTVLAPASKAQDPASDDQMQPAPTSTTATMGPPTLSPEVEHAGGSSVAGDLGNPSNSAGGNVGLGAAAAAAAAAAQQPKVVQTAFIHKLYNMLEDPNIQHLISWSTTNESFVMSPSSEFSKVLSQYFKHTNISSFVRQLNMYGFHKVSDVFHTGAPESTLWEFKHGNGNFKRGDLMGLREIKRRASRHALINRDTFSASHKVNASQPGTPAEPAVMESADCRITNLEHSVYELHTRLARSEEINASLNSRCHASTEAVLRFQHWTRELSNLLLELIPDPEHPMRREIPIMQREITKQMEILRSQEDPSEMYLTIRQPRIPHHSPDAAPLSPRQVARDDPRRPTQLSVPQPNFFRPPPPAHSSVSPRRYGSVGNGHYSPGSLRSHIPPPPPPPPYSLSSMHPSAALGRRHTSADIRLHGWQGQGPGPGPAGSPFASGQSSVQWPSSPKRTSNAGDHSQHVRDLLARYEMPSNSTHQHHPHHQHHQHHQSHHPHHHHQHQNHHQPSSYGSRQTTPPLTSDTTPSTTSGDSTWSFAGSRNVSKGTETTAGSFSRRSSMASNVHSLLNPTDTVERMDEDDPLAISGGGGGGGTTAATSVVLGEDRKRKRLQ